MGNRSSALPSPYLKGRWLADEEVSSCCNCELPFTITRRRHHCRCCGQIYCDLPDCWGRRVLLPAEYGYPDPEPTCTACYDMYVGTLKKLREQRCVAVTFTLRDKKEAAVPPMCAKTIADKNFKLYYMRIHDWRPFNHETHLQFAVKSDKAARTEQVRIPSRLEPALEHSTAGGTAAAGGTRKSVGGTTRAVPRMSSLEPASSRDSSPGGRDDDDDDGFGMDDSASAGRGSLRRSNSSSRRSAGRGGVATVPTDVAFTIPLNSVLNAVLDSHGEGDYVTLETSQQYIRIQVIQLSDAFPQGGGGGGGGGDASTASASYLDDPGVASSHLAPHAAGDTASVRSGDTGATTKKKRTGKVDVEGTKCFFNEVLDATRRLRSRCRIMSAAAGGTSAPPSRGPSVSGSASSFPDDGARLTSTLDAPPRRGSVAPAP